MLSPPLSLLSDDLLNYIVDHVAKLRRSNLYLQYLSITDRAFTRFCQAHLFKDLYLGYESGTNKSISKKLAKIRNILNDEPSFAHRVRAVHLTFAENRNRWLFNDPTFITVIQLLAKSPIPPHKLHLTSFWPSHHPFIIEDPILIVGWLMQSFFSQTLTVLDLIECKNVPLTLFLVCPNLKEVYLDDVEVFDSRDDEYTQCSGRELPSPEHLSYIRSGSLVKQMITPPPKFSMPVVDFSKLRVLKLCPQEKKDMVCLQPILDAACDTLEELYLTNLQATWDLAEEQLSLAGLVDLRHLPNLNIFAIHTFIKCDAQEPVVLGDIDLVLSTIPKANHVTKLSLSFTIYYGELLECLEEDWGGICYEVVRISAGKPLELNLKMLAGPAIFHDYQYPSPGIDELDRRIKEKIASLSYYPNICTLISASTGMEYLIPSNS